MINWYNLIWSINGNFSQRYKQIKKDFFEMLDITISLSLGNFMVQKMSTNSQKRFYDAFSALSSIISQNTAKK